jgi:hypothetical protein
MPEEDATSPAVTLLFWLWSMALITESLTFLLMASDSMRPPGPGTGSKSSSSSSYSLKLLLFLLLYAAQIETFRLTVWIFDDDNDDDHDFSSRFRACRRGEEVEEEREIFIVGLLCFFHAGEEEEEVEEKAPVPEREDIKVGRIDNIFFVLYDEKEERRRKRKI